MDRIAMTSEPSPDDEPLRPPAGPPRRVFFVRMDQPDEGQGPHWKGLPATLSGSTGHSGPASPGDPRPAEPPATTPTTSYVPAAPTPTPPAAPQPIAATATETTTKTGSKPATETAAKTATSGPSTAPMSATTATPANEDSIQAQAREIFAHLKSRLRLLQRRQREIERQTADMEARRAELARGTEFARGVVAEAGEGIGAESDPGSRPYGRPSATAPTDAHSHSSPPSLSNRDPDGRSLPASERRSDRRSDAGQAKSTSWRVDGDPASLAASDQTTRGRSRSERLSQPRPRPAPGPSVPDFAPIGEPESPPAAAAAAFPWPALSSLPGSTPGREEELRRRESELTELSQRLRDRELSLDRERDALNQLKSEVADRHQETLEMRLACEQLWSQLASRMEAPLLVESLAKLRRRLADQYHNAAVEMAQRRDEAREWVARLDERQRDLRRQRDEIQSWIYRRHEELEIERLKLLRREQELDARERAQQSQQAEMQRQLGEYQRQIRQLTAQLRCKSELDRLAP